MAKDTGTTMKHHNVGQYLYTLESGNTTPCTSSWPFCAVLMYFQLGRVQTYTDFCVWRNNYGNLATNVNPVTAPHSGAVTTSLNAL